MRSVFGTKSGGKAVLRVADRFELLQEGGLPSPVVFAEKGEAFVLHAKGFCERIEDVFATNRSYKAARSMAEDIN